MKRILTSPPARTEGMAEFIGVLHVHSTFSDGAMSPREIRDWALSEQLDFVCITDHSAGLATGRRRRLIDECGSLSGEVLLVPGIEYAHSGRHVIVLGPPECLLRLSDEEVVRTPDVVRRCGGLTIWAHPALTYDLSLRDGAAAHYDGWEMWNVKTDGCSPNLALISLLQQAARQRRILPLAGLDLHDRQASYQAPRVVVSSPQRSLTPNGLFGSLREGHFRIESNGVPQWSANSLSLQPSLCDSIGSSVRHIKTRMMCSLRYIAHRTKVGIAKYIR